MASAEAAPASPSSSSQPTQLHLMEISTFCPTIASLQAIVRSRIAPWMQVERLTKAILRSSALGDVDVLAWFLDRRDKGLIASSSSISSTGMSTSQPDAMLFAQIDIRSIRDPEGGMGPVTLATSAGHFDAVKMLVEYGADVDERDEAGWTPLMWAINSSHHPLVSYLLRRGADVEARTLKGVTCEDFVVSLAPEEPGTSAHSRSRDDEHIADTVYEYLQASAWRKAEEQSRILPNGLAKSRDLNRSHTPPPNGSRSSSGPGTPVSGGQPAIPVRTHSRALTHRSSMASLTTSTTSRRLMGKYERNQIREAGLRAREVMDGRRRAMHDMAVLLDVDFQDVQGQQVVSEEDGPLRTSWAVRKGKQRRRESSHSYDKDAHSTLPTALAQGCGAREVGADPLSQEFDFDQISPHQMLVIGENDVPAVVDQLVSQTRPTRAPWIKRAEVANVSYLWMRSAVACGDEDLLGNILVAVLDRAEEELRKHEASITHSAFWLFNLTLLLHYFKRDADLSALPEANRSYIVDLVNEAYVTIIRDVERRLNRILEAAMLEHESIPGFSELQFEGEWTLMKSLKGSVRSQNSPRRPLSQFFQNVFDDSAHNVSPTKNRHVRGKSNGNSLSLDTMSKVADDATYVPAEELLTHLSPRTVTFILTAALHILQLYEINPATIVQAFSQIFFWLGSELFNKVLTNKRYLCRSKAMQLKLSVSTLEDWARSNALPLSIVNTHFAPLNQLISWLACQSSLQDFDSLVATMQSLKALNPLQMRRAVKDYRYEVGESRMSEELWTTLEQFAADWERREEMVREEEEEKKARRELEKMRAEIIQQDQEAAARYQDEDLDNGIGHHHRSGTITRHGATRDSRSPSPVGSAGDKEADTSNGTAHAMQRQVTVGPQSNQLSLEEEGALKAQEAIDSLFLSGRSISDYHPPLAPLPNKKLAASKGDLLHSSCMLPFALPSRCEALIVSPGDAFGFGRGHFTGTGTPTLKDAREGGGNDVTPTTVGGDDSLLAPPGPSSTTDDDSVRSGMTSSSTGRSTCFTSGKGFAAGGYWQPVPLVEEETLDRLTTVMRRGMKEWERSRFAERRVLSFGKGIPASPTSSSVHSTTGLGSRKVSRASITLRSPRWEEEPSSASSDASFGGGRPLYSELLRGANEEPVDWSNSASTSTVKSADETLKARRTEGLGVLNE